MVRRFRLSWLGFVFAVWSVFVPVAALHAQQAGILSSLEIGSYKTPIEYLRFPLDQPLSASRFDYTATVSDQYTAKFNITATDPAASDKITINGVAVKSGVPYEVNLQEGVNKYEITVASDEATTARYHLTVNRKDLSKVYTSEKIGDGIWRVFDFGGTRGDESFYLITGAKRALLLDTGMGKGDLPAYLRTLTSLPIDVAITHGHGDHFGQVNEFKNSTVYIGEQDATRLPLDFITPKFHYLKDGDVIDLGGGRQLEAINVPGHTIGSMVYLDRKDNLLITGDALSSGSMVYMFMPNTTALDEYLQGLKHLQSKINGMNDLTFLVGHSYQEKVPLKGAAAQELVADMRAAAEKVLAGQLVGKAAYTSFGTHKLELRQAYVGLAGLWYNPHNLHTAPAALNYLDVKTPEGQLLKWDPVFASQTTTYTVEAPSSISTLVVTPTAYWPNYKRITVNGTEVKSGGSHRVQLSGAGTIDVTITGNDSSTETYSVHVKR
ncbi:MAG: cadherin-like beta sandwich domain-containing protein [Acidobacteriota bacterium]